MDKRRRWQAGSWSRAGASVPPRPRSGLSNPWVAAALGVLALGLGAIGGTLLFLALSSPRGGEGAPRAATSVEPTPAARSTAPTPDASSRPPAPTLIAPPQSGGPPLAWIEATPGNELPGSPAASGPSPAVSPADWRVEQALRGLATDEAKVGQLLLVGWGGDTAEDARTTIRALRPGGIILMGNTQRAAEATRINAELPKIAAEYGIPPPLLAVDHEGGPVQRIDDVANLGSNSEFASRRPSDRMACERGLTHARQLRAMGFTMNLAPVLDVNNNPDNPVIGSRSYGADPELVARLGSAYVRGLQGGGVAAVGKHFPGHGNTGVDSHLELPILPQTAAQLEQIELVPFQRVIASPTDIAAIMSAHIVFPAVDPTRAPATLSRPIMTGLLREKLRFRGLVVSDDLGAMKAITDHYTPGQAALRAIQAGVDMLIIVGGIPRQRASRDALLAALDSGELSRERLEQAVRGVLRVKARFGLLGEPNPPERSCS